MDPDPVKRQNSDGKIKYTTQLRKTQANKHPYSAE